MTEFWCTRVSSAGVGVEKRTTAGAGTGFEWEGGEQLRQRRKDGRPKQA